MPGNETTRCAVPEWTHTLRYEITIDLSEDDDPQHVYDMIEHLLFDLGEVGTLSMKSVRDE